jgi:hypothetical protein
MSGRRAWKGKSDREEGDWCGRRKERVKRSPVNQRRSGDHLIRHKKSDSRSFVRS